MRSLTPMFPIFLKLEHRACLVVGAGNMAEAKIRVLLRCGAEVRVVAPAATARIAAWERAERIAWRKRAFEPADLRNVFLVIVATSSAAVNSRVYGEARRRGILCNAVDDPANCDFFFPAIVRRGPLQIAVSTSGQSPALAQRLRRRLERQFGPQYGPLVRELGRYRRKLFSLPMDKAERRRLLHLAAGRALARTKP